MMYMIVTIVSLVALCCFYSCHSAGLADSFPSLDYQVYLDEEENFSFHWSLVNDTHMEIGIACNNVGWCAMGISPNGQMPDSDINFFWIDDATSDVYLQDRYASTRSVPSYDSEQDLFLIEGSQTDGISYIHYIREQFSCDSEDNQIEIGTTRLLYAYNENDPTQEFFDSSSVVAHSHKGSKSVNLLSGSGFVVDLPDDAISVDLTVDDVSVPSDDTTYYCKLFKLPQTNETQHIVRFEPIVEEGNEGVVHHMLLYYCPSAYVEEDDVGTESSCGNFAEMPIGASSCVYGTAAFSWAIGGEDFSFPSTVGLEMSGTNNADGSELQYLLLEIHYDNPDRLTNIVDNSGFRIWYTPTLREESAGLIEIGLVVYESQFIPGGISSTLNTGLCGSDCTSEGLPETGVKLFASMLHAHTVGIALNLRHVRNGVELEPIDQNWNYDFDYQNMVAITDEIDLLPGDDLILDCYYNTSDRDDMTFGGQSTIEEMCLVYIYVYPKPTLTECMSAPTADDLIAWGTIAGDRGYVDINEIYVNQQLRLDKIEYDTSIAGSISWYQAFWSNYTGRTQQCDDAFGNDLISGSNIVQFPTITQEYEQSICGQSVGIPLTYDTNVGDSDDGDGGEGGDNSATLVGIGWITVSVVVMSAAWI